MGLFVLVKTKKGKILGAVPARKGRSAKRLMTTLRSKLKKNLTFTIVSSSKIKKFIMRLNLNKKRKRL